MQPAYGWGCSHLCNVIHICCPSCKKKIKLKKTIPVTGCESL
jgi:hypothetical protein